MFWILFYSVSLWIAANSKVALAVEPYPFSSIKSCTKTSLQLSEVEDAAWPGFPCIVHDVNPDLGEGSNVSVITIIQVTPNTCADHRDGAVTSLKVINAQNAKQGFAVGFNKRDYVSFRLVSVVAGINEKHDFLNYNETHESVLRGMLDDSSGLNAQFVIGTCSFASDFEKEAVEENKRILLAQVGPDAYYDDPKYIFGIHLSSHQYTIPALRIIKFRTSHHDLSIAVFGRDSSDFFNTTCSAAVDFAEKNQIGNAFSNLPGGRITYKPEDALNKTLMREVAAKVCNSNADYYIGCINSEVQEYLDKWKEMGCQPKGVWLTCATWSNFKNNPDRKYILGAGQYHPEFSGVSFGDEFFNSGAELLKTNENEFGYTPDYNTVVSYVVPYVYMKAVQDYFQLADSVNVKSTFETNYEGIRRALKVITISRTLFGRVNFDIAKQRNIGRDPAATQWLLDEDDKIQDIAVAPLDVAQNEILFPSLASQACPEGQYSDPIGSNSTCLLCKKCSLCPVDHYNPDIGATSCLKCPSGTSTYGEVGATFCTAIEQNLFAGWIKAIAITCLVINYSLILIFFVWLWVKAETKVVRYSQPIFLRLVLFGTMMSTSAIIPLIMDGVESGSRGLNAACMIAPWLYSWGWILSFSALFAKSWRLGKIVNNTRMRRIEIKARSLVKIILACLSCSGLILLVWTVVDPLVWSRRIDTETSSGNVLTISYANECTTTKGTVWRFLGPLFVFHVGLLSAGNVVLYNVRNINSFFQERKYISISVFGQTEVLLLGVPLIFAVGDDYTTRVLIFALIIFINDCSCLCLIFVPKIIAVYSFEGQSGSSDSKKSMARFGSSHSNLSLMKEKLNPLELTRETSLCHADPPRNKNSRPHAATDASSDPEERSKVSKSVDEQAKADGTPGDSRKPAESVDATILDVSTIESAEGIMSDSAEVEEVKLDVQ